MSEDLEQLFLLFKNVLLMMYRRDYEISDGLEKIFKKDFINFQHKFLHLLAALFPVL